MTLALALRRERVAADISQAALAKTLGISPQYLCDMELGKRRLSEDRISLLPDMVRRAVALAAILEHEEAIGRLRSIAEAPPVKRRAQR